MLFFIGQQNHIITVNTNDSIEVRECLLSFGAGSFVFQFAIQKFKGLNIKNSVALVRERTIPTGLNIQN